MASTIGPGFCIEDTRPSPEVTEGEVWSCDIGLPIDWITACSEESDCIILALRDDFGGGCHLGGLGAVSAKTGRLLWKQTPHGYIKEGSVVGNQFICVETSYRLTSYDIASGKVIWERDLDHEASPPVLDENHIFVGADGWTGAFDVHGTELWSIKGCGGLVSPIVLGEKLIVGGSTGGVRCVDSRSGREIWRSTLTFNPVAVDGEHIICCTDQRLAAIRQSDGATIWNWSPGEGRYVDGVSVSKSLIFGRTWCLRSLLPKYSGSIMSEYRIEVVNTENGKLRWNVPVTGGESVWRAGEVLIIGGDAYRLSDGTKTIVPANESHSEFSAFGFEFRTRTSKDRDSKLPSILYAVRRSESPTKK
jgi:outer membrane protein assembly factor BamB